MSEDQERGEGTAGEIADTDSLFTVLDPDDAFRALRRLFDAADEDESGYLDRDELAHVVRLFYQQEKVCRSLKVVQREVNEAVRRFDANGDGQLQFEEFVDMFALSDSFRFAMPVSLRLEVRDKMLQEKVWRVRNELMEERELMVDDATRLEKVKVRQLETKVESLTARLDEKVLQVRNLEEDLADTKDQLGSTQNRLQAALSEVDRLHKMNMEIPDIGLSPNSSRSRSASNAVALSLSPRMSASPQRGRISASPQPGPLCSFQSPRSARLSGNHGDILSEVMSELLPEPPRTPRQGELRRKPIVAVD